MKLSIVTISYNQRQYLERAIRSVIDQAFVDLEYIVVDPGSTDGSRDIIERYRDQIAHVILEIDEGPADGLNKGFSRATGDWFGYINSDDYYLPGGLARASKAAERFNDHAAIVGNGYIVDPEDRKLCRSISTKFSLERALHGACFSLQQATFYRRDLFFDAGGFNPRNRTCWDGEILIELARRGGRIGRFYEDVGAFRIHSQSITGSGRLSEKYHRDTETIFERIKGRGRTSFDRLVRGPVARAGARLFDPRRNIDLALDRWRQPKELP